VGGRVGEGADRLQQLDHRARPAVGHDERQRVLVLRHDVDEVDVHPVDLGHELWQRVKLGLSLAPFVVAGPVAGELLDRGQLHALGAVGDQLLGGPARRGDAAAQLSEVLVGDADLEGADGGDLGRCGSLGGATGPSGSGDVPSHYSGLLIRRSIAYDFRIF
jgi:hypothetical protein